MLLSSQFRQYFNNDIKNWYGFEIWFCYSDLQYSCSISDIACDVHKSLYLQCCRSPLQGRMQDSKLGVAQMDLKIWKAGGGGGGGGGGGVYEYISSTIVIIRINVFQIR